MQLDAGGVGRRADDGLQTGPVLRRSDVRAGADEGAGLDQLALGGVDVGMNARGAIEALGLDRGGVYVRAVGLDGDLLMPAGPGDGAVGGHVEASAGAIVALLAAEAAGRGALALLGEGPAVGHVGALLKGGVSDQVGRRADQGDLAIRRGRSRGLGDVEVEPGDGAGGKVAGEDQVGAAADAVEGPIAPGDAQGPVARRGTEVAEGAAKVGGDEDARPGFGIEVEDMDGAAVVVGEAIVEPGVGRGFLGQLQRLLRPDRDLCRGRAGDEPE